MELINVTASPQKAETGRLWKDFSLWVSEKRDERLYDDYENINSVPNLIANSTLQTTELTKMSGKNRGINIIKGAGDAGISLVEKTGEWITNIPDIFKEQVNTITNTDYVEVVSDITKNHTFKEDVKKLYNNAVDATTNLYEDVDKMFTSDNNSEVIPASQNATEFTAGVIGAFIPVNKATKAINITKAPDKTPTSSSDTPSKTEHNTSKTTDDIADINKARIENNVNIGNINNLKEHIQSNVDESRKAREASGFNTHIENERRVEHRHQQDDKIYYGHNVYDESFRTPEADKVGQDVLKAMEGVITKERLSTVNIMLHQDGTVSVGLSGDLTNPKTLERIQATQQALDKKYGVGKYKVGIDTLSDKHGLKPVQGSNNVGACAEPKCSVAAQANPSPVTGFAIMWRGQKDNPYPIKSDEAKQRGLSSNQMYMCATCELNKEVYEQYINNSIKK